MNTLDWVVNELISTLEDYISTNKQYFDYLQEQTNKSTTPNPTDSESAIQSAQAQATTSDYMVRAGSTDQLGYMSTAKLVVESLIFTKVALKSEKYSEAKMFVSQVKAIINREMKYEREDIRKKITDLSKVLDDEVAKMTVILNEHKQKSGTYDALLRIFADVLNWLKREENLDVLSVAIKYEMLGEKHKVVKDAIKVGNANYYVPLPLTQSLVTYLTRQMLRLHLDAARIKEHDRIPYVRLLDEVQAEEVMDCCRFHVLFIDQHTNQNNAKDCAPVRQNNNRVVLGSLRMECTDIYNRMQGYIMPTRNVFMDSMLNQLQVWFKQADEKIRERVKAAIEANQGRVLVAPAPSVPSLS